MQISDYIDKLNGVAHNLALAGKLVDEDDLVTLIPNGVGTIYEATVNSIQARDSAITLDDLIDLLLSAEMQQEDHNSVLLDSSNSALYAPKSKHNNHYKNSASQNARFHDKSSPMPTGNTSKPGNGSSGYN